MVEQKKNKKKSKLTLNRLGLILIVVVAAANIYVWRTNAASEMKIAELTDNITMVQQQINTVPEPADDLESRLEAVTEELAATKEGFPATVDRNKVIEYLLKTADECGIQILPLSSEGWEIEDLGQSYNVLSLSAIAEGTLKNVKIFMTEIQNGQYPTLTIPDCSVGRSGVAEISAAEDEMRVTANLKIGIYTFTPEPEEESL